MARNRNLLRGLISMGKRLPTQSDIDDLGTNPLAVFQYRIGATIDPAAITSGAMRDVPLDTTVHNGITGVSLAANIITIAEAGDYMLLYWVGAWIEGNIAFNVQCSVYDDTGATEVTASGGRYGDWGDTGQSAPADMGLISFGSCKVSLAASNDYKLQVQVSGNCVYAEQSPWTSQALAEITIIKL